MRVTAMEASASSVPGTGDAFVIDLTRGSHDPGGAPYGLVTVAECPNGARRVAVSLDPYGFVAYIQRDGRVTSREDPDAETEDP